MPQVLDTLLGIDHGKQKTAFTTKSGDSYKCYHSHLCGQIALAARKIQGMGLATCATENVCVGCVEIGFNPAPFLPMVPNQPSSDPAWRDAVAQWHNGGMIFALTVQAPQAGREVGDDFSIHGCGGGAMRLSVAGDLVLGAGAHISADAGPCSLYYGTGGAGGSILIVAHRPLQRLLRFPFLVFLFPPFPH